MSITDFSIIFTLDISLIYTTFILGPALLKTGTLAVTFGTARLIFCHVKANFLASGPKNSGGPGPPPVAGVPKRDFAGLSVSGRKSVTPFFSL